MKIDLIAANRGIPKKYLEQILIQLKEAGIARSRRGAEGGYVLMVPPTGITVARIMAVSEGKDREGGQGRGEGPGGGPLHRLLDEAVAAAWEKLEAKSFADLLDEAAAPGPPKVEDLE